jgi:hypothetical protein
VAENDTRKCDECGQQVIELASGNEAGHGMTCSQNPNRSD